MTNRPSHHSPKPNFKLIVENNKNNTSQQMFATSFVIFFSLNEDIRGTAPFDAINFHDTVLFIKKGTEIVRTINHRQNNYSIRLFVTQTFQLFHSIALGSVTFILNENFVGDKVCSAASFVRSHSSNRKYSNNQMDEHFYSFKYGSLIVSQPPTTPFY
jgi:hypothetical protein